MWGGKLAAIKGTRGSTRSEEEGTKIKRRRSEERSRDNYYYSTIAYKDYIFHPFVIIKSVLFPSHSHYLCYVYTAIAGTENVNIDTLYSHMCIY